MGERHIPVRQQLWQKPVFSQDEGEPLAPTRHQVDVWRAEASNFPATLDELPYGRRDWVDVVATRAFQAGWASATALLEQRHPEPVPAPKGPTRDDLWELWLRLNNELPDRPAAVAEFWEHAQIDARARAADLLAQRPEPVPVSERPWEREGWCDERGWCWFGAPEFCADDAIWTLHPPAERLSKQTVCLPANALPLPAGRWAMADPVGRRTFPTPHQIAECGGPCEQGGPQNCDCGLYQRSPGTPTPMADLSPAARAVLDAMRRSYDHEPTRRLIAADILRSVADQVVPETANAVGDSHDEARQDQWLRIRWKILAIAAELEGADGQ